MHAACISVGSDKYQLADAGDWNQAEVVVFLPIPKKRVSGQMFGNYRILCMRFKLPLGNTRGNLLVCWKLILPGMAGNPGGREQGVGVY